MFRKLRHARGGNRSSDLSRLEVPHHPNEQNYKQCRDPITLDTPKDIKQKLRERNKSHFGQVHGSFPAIPPFLEWIDWGASTHQAELILESTFSST